ncbi:TPA: hypothetical protein KRH92_002762 [Clostridioides difficile]|uniref:hypothetical protein n=1 Tax=Clostridioides difficile TaxID=1496 RepID=UPI001025728B|nr:hypothetical protein [Clostridioides difficile]QVW56638.1 hypothetical protein [Clostridioides phage CD1801]EGT3685132.1 hypothetical protein [Clostridioides difficile]MBZ0630094.1 hypothetical protein [Clostridioides difficile]MDV9565863.1 hypothetical protein [Clostridioides difficile]MDV9570552.1 hypothetical protein [Clostridioides difficile]
MESLKIVKQYVEGQLNLSSLEIDKNKETYEILKNKSSRDMLDDINLNDALREVTVNERLKIFAESLLELLDTQIKIKESEESEDYKRLCMYLDEFGRDIPIDVQI